MIICFWFVIIEIGINSSAPLLIVLFGLFFVVVTRTGCSLLAYHAPWLLNQWPIHAVHLVVKAAGVAEVMAGAVSSPERSRHRSAIHALTTLRKVLGLDVVHYFIFSLLFYVCSPFYVSLLFTLAACGRASDIDIVLFFNNNRLYYVLTENCMFMTICYSARILFNEN